MRTYSKLLSFWYPPERWFLRGYRRWTIKILQKKKKRKRGINRRVSVVCSDDDDNNNDNNRQNGTLIRNTVYRATGVWEAIERRSDGNISAYYLTIIRQRPSSKTHFSGIDRWFGFVSGIYTNYYSYTYTEDFCEQLLKHLIFICSPTGDDERLRL